MTPKQELFCNAFLETGNASEAYRKAYSCGNMKTETINRNAFALINNNKIAARVRELQSELKKNSDIRKEDILEELSCIVFADIRDYVEFNGTTIKFKPFDKLTDKQARAIESIKETRLGIEIKLHGKAWSVERICKVLGFESPTSFNMNVKNWSEETVNEFLYKTLGKGD
nr:terminase small subunit [uncultured Draconibacterium sp.]